MSQNVFQIKQEEVGEEQHWFSINLGSEGKASAANSGCYLRKKRKESHELSTIAPSSSGNSAEKKVSLPGNLDYFPNCPV